jgi:hypothetical protein
MSPPAVRGKEWHWAGFNNRLQGFAGVAYRRKFITDEWFHPDLITDKHQACVWEDDTWFSMMAYVGDSTHSRLSTHQRCGCEVCDRVSDYESDLVCIRRFFLICERCKRFATNKTIELYSAPFSQLFLTSPSISKKGFKCIR